MSIACPCVVFRRLVEFDMRPYGLAHCSDIPAAWGNEMVALVHRGDDATTSKCAAQGIPFVLCESRGVTSDDVRMALRMLRRMRRRSVALS